MGVRPHHLHIKKIASGLNDRLIGSSTPSSKHWGSFIGILLRKEFKKIDPKGDKKGALLLLAPMKVISLFMDLFAN